MVSNNPFESMIKFWLFIWLAFGCSYGLLDFIEVNRAGRYSGVRVFPCVSRPRVHFPVLPLRSSGTVSGLLSYAWFWLPRRRFIGSFLSQVLTPYERKEWWATIRRRGRHAGRVRSFRGRFGWPTPMRRPCKSRLLRVRPRDPDCDLEAS
jgi:hypothetical protein